MEDLKALDNQRPQSTWRLPIISWEVHTPLVLQEWTKELSVHPDQTFSQYILEGIQTGFRIGFNRDQTLSSAVSNLHCNNPQKVTEYLLREVSLHRMWRLPLGTKPSGIHISPLGLIPKKNKPGKWRMIVDLSSPTNTSVNDGISTDMASLSYASIDHLAALIVMEGRGSFLVKADIKEAYKIVPVHPEDQHLLGVEWEGVILMDKTLPFGLRSAPKIFSAVADAAQWILKKEGVNRSLHYLDDYVLVAGSISSAMAQKRILINTFTRLGIPLEESKLEGPSSCLSFLGIEVDTVNLQLRLPHSKLVDLLETLERCIEHESLRKHDLEHLTGLLQFTTKVVRPGRPFLRRLYALQSVGSFPNHLVRLSRGAQADILWWFYFVKQWNGVSLLWDLGLLREDIQVFSDASGSWGCAAFQDPYWLQQKWTPGLCKLTIAIKELIPVVLAAAVFGPNWSGMIVQFVVDNAAVVDALKATYCNESHMMHLIRLLVFYAAKYNFWFTAVHIPGKENVIADALSRNKMSVFFSQVPQATRHPAHITPALLDLVSRDLPWISTHWMSLFNDSMQQGCQNHPIKHTK